MPNIRHNTRSDEDKAPIALEVTQEHQDALNKCSDHKQTTQAKESTPPEESKSDAKEESDDEIDYQCVVWDGTFLAASCKVATAFTEMPPAR